MVRVQMAMSSLLSHDTSVTTSMRSVPELSESEPSDSPDEEEPVDCEIDDEDCEDVLSWLCEEVLCEEVLCEEVLCEDCELL